ncbi:maleylpyruvate isomerase family mycothiol-dependent enzyme [Jatrophihabitans sp.]|uniref:maleylpyruvate isomerase family mycothiol-dependent enzyme n=1 Tax=Jatrophihabitans sp. TaxID=1932789 RepID=UPI002CDFADA8|nr:maleylpyruvate isomerase family mycothiol-dependent enzyme [Jatrophihabitans sp.]
MYYQLYVDSARRVADLVAPLDDATLQTLTPACPDWTVHDVLAHLAGAASSFGTPDFAGVGTDPWTAGHVGSRRDTPVADLLAERQACLPKLEKVPLDNLRAWLPIVHDALTHEADIRGAIGAPGLPADALAAAFPLLEAVLPRRLSSLGPMSVELDGQPRTWGDGTPELTVKTSMFDFWRGAFGRRSPGQMRSWVVAGDAEAFARTLPNFGPRATDLVEFA